MSIFSDIVKEELKSIVINQEEPRAKVLPKDRVVGYVTDPEIKKQYILAVRWKVAALYSHTFEATEKAKHLENDFRISLRILFGFWGKQELLVKEGWRVVYYDPNILPTSEEVVEHILKIIKEERFKYDEND